MQSESLNYCQRLHSFVVVTPQDVTFPHWKRWCEWNLQFKIDVRRFLRGEPDQLSEFATRLCGRLYLFLHNSLVIVFSILDFPRGTFVNIVHLCVVPSSLCCVVQSTFYGFLTYRGTAVQSIACDL